MRDIPIRKGVANYKLSAGGIKPMDEKVQAITDRLRLENLKELGSYMGALFHLHNIITKLAIFMCISPTFIEA